MKEFLIHNLKIHLRLKSTTKLKQKQNISLNFAEIFQNSHCVESNFNPFFYWTLSKPLPKWFRAVETGLLHFYSTIFEDKVRWSNYQAYITKTNYIGKPLPLGTFVSNVTLLMDVFLTNINTFGLFLIVDRLSDVIRVHVRKMVQLFLHKENISYLSNKKNNIFLHSHIQNF